MRKLTEPTTYRSVFSNDNALFDNANGIPIKLLTKVIPITEPTPKIKIKLKISIIYEIVYVGKLFSF